MTIDTVKKNDLIGAAAALDSAEYLLQDLQDNYFGFDDTTPDGQRFILYEYQRGRAKTAALRFALEQITTTFKELNISPYF